MIQGTRNKQIDALNGIGILLVVMGHYDNQMNSQAWYDWIYSFHMPLFFITGGYLWGIKREKYLKDKFVSYCKRRVKHLLVPYAVFCGLSFLVSSVLMPIYRGNFHLLTLDETITVIYSTILGGGYLTNDRIRNFPLWFLQLYFLAGLVFYLIRWVEKRNVKIVCAVMTILVISIRPFQMIMKNVLGGRPPYHINVLPVALVFMECGYLYYRYFACNSEKICCVLKNKKNYIACCLMTVGISVSYVFPSSIADLRSYWYIVGALATVGAFYLMLYNFQPKILCIWGESSLLILGIHALVIGFFRNFLQPYLFPKWAGAFLYFIDSMIIMYVLTCIVLIWNKFVHRE